MQNLLLITVSGVTAGAVILRLYIQRRWGTCTSSRSMDGKTVIVTGANSGLGKVTALELAKKGARVILACRNEQSAKEAIQDIRNKCGENSNVSFKQLDLASFSSVKQFAAEIERDEKKLDVLVSNAGVYSCPNSITEDGFETQFQVNHLSHALLELLLMPKLEHSGSESDPSRIVVVTSSLALNGLVRESDFEQRKSLLDNYNGVACYRSSKLASLIFSRELANKLKSKKLLVNLCLASPGFVWTNLGRYVKTNPLMYIFFAPIALVAMRTPYQGSQSILEGIFSEKVIDKAGMVIRNCQEAKDFIPKKFDMKSSQVFEKTLQSLGVKSIDDYIK